MVTIEGKIYIGVGDGNWLGVFHEYLMKGYNKGGWTKDKRGRHWLVMERETKPMRLE